MWISLRVSTMWRQSQVELIPRLIYPRVVKIKDIADTLETVIYNNYVCQVKKVKESINIFAWLLDAHPYIHKLYLFCFSNETAFLIVKCMNKINLLWKDIFEVSKIKFIVDMAWQLFLNKSKQLEIMTMTLYVVIEEILLRICNSYPYVCFYVISM